MVQSLVGSCVVTMAGGLLASKSQGVAPSTVMKKFVGLSGLLGSESTSEKYNLRCLTGSSVSSPSKRCACAFLKTAGILKGGSGASWLVWIVAKGRVGSLFPTGPVFTFRGRKVAFFTLFPGPVTMNSALAAGASRM